MVQENENSVGSQCYLSNARQKSETSKTPVRGHFLSFLGIARLFHHVVNCLEAQVTRDTWLHVIKVKETVDK